MNIITDDPNAEKIVIEELKNAGITIIRDNSRLGGNVSVSVVGQFRSFRFVRAWRYWVVTGRVPLDVAKELFDNPIGVADIRVDGSGRRPRPEDKSTWFDDEGRELVDVESTRESENFNKRHNRPPQKDIFVIPKEDFSKFGKPFITLYHIDSQEGLNLFIETLKQFNVN